MEMPLPKKPTLSDSSRYQIAITVSLVVHGLLIVLLGLGIWCSPTVRRQVLIPIELAIAEQVEPQPAETAAIVVTASQPQPTTEQPPEQKVVAGGLKLAKTYQPSGFNKQVKPGPAAPAILTSKNGTEAAGQVANGVDKAGEGGGEEGPAGPTYGPAVVSGPMPVYPKGALDQDLEGKVSLTVKISSAGSVESVSVKSSSGHEMLDRAAVRAVQRGWLFKSGMTAGKSAAGEITVTFEFSGGTVKGG